MSVFVKLGQRFTDIVSSIPVRIVGGRQPHKASPTIYDGISLFVYLVQDRLGLRVRVRSILIGLWECRELLERRSVFDRIVNLTAGQEIGRVHSAIAGIGSG